MTSLPSQCVAVIGHETAKKQIEEAYDSGRMHHAWLLIGPEGIGKASLAFHIAHLVLSGGANRFGKFNPQNPDARQIMAESHPDLFILRRPVDEKTGKIKETIPVEEARKLSGFLRLTASKTGGRRVAIVDEAHLMNRNAQNAILKMIEEPPSGAVIILTATTVGMMLPTIRSRCRLLPLEPLKPQEMEVVLARLGAEIPSGAEKARLLELSGGSVGLALKILESEALAFFEEALDLLKNLPDLDMPRLHRLGDLMGKKADAESFKIVTELLVETLRKAVRSAALGQKDGFGLAAKLAPAGRLDKALEVWENMRETFAMANGANLDNKLALIAAMTALARAAR